MGCCSSRQSQSSPSPAKEQHGFQQGPVFETKELEGTPQVVISNAGWLNKSSLSATTAVHLDEARLIAAVFDWHGSPVVSTYCVKNVISVFLSLLNTRDIPPLSCIKRTFLQLDSSFLADSSVTDYEKCRSGASGTILYCDLRSQKVCVGSIGNCTTAFGRLVHGLSSQLTRATYLSVPGSPRCGKALAAIDESETLCLGDGRFKRSSLAALYGKPIPEHLAWSSKRELGPISLSEHELRVQDEHIILGSGGLWSLVTADDAMLRSHFFVKANWDCGTSEGKVLGEGSPHVARHLIKYAKNRPNSPTQHAMNVDAVAVVVTLRWPASSLNQAFPAQQGTFLQSLRAQMAPDTSTASGRARLQWRKICMLTVEFNRARRRALHSAWITLVGDALRDGKQRARKIEEAYWQKHQAVVRVTPSGKITDSKGNALLPTTLMMEARC